MELDVIIKIIGVVSAPIVALKPIYDINLGGESRLREKYKFAKGFFEDLKNNPDMSPFEKELGYQAIVGSQNISAKEVAYLLSLKNPCRCLNDYLFSRKYLQAIEKNGDLCLNYSDKHANDWKRNFRKRTYFTLYWIFASIAFVPIFLPQNLNALLIGTIPIFGYYAFTALNTYSKIDRAEKLVNNQQRHTSNIHLSSNENFFLHKK
jgi:hypothetical protein